MAYELIQSTRTTGSVSAVTLTSISQDYIDLVGHIFIPTGSSMRSRLYFNGVTSPSPPTHWTWQNNTTLGGNVSSATVIPFSDTTKNNQARPFQYTFQITDYTSSGNKSFLANSASYDPTIVSSQLFDTNYSAITQIEFVSYDSTYPTDTLFELYGRK